MGLLRKFDMATATEDFDALSLAQLDPDAAKFCGDDLDGEQIIPGFRVPLSTLFGRKKKSKRQPEAD
jgi:hypothetical protein